DASDVALRSALRSSHPNRIRSALHEEVRLPGDPAYDHVRPGIEYLERARYTVIVNRRPLMDHREAVARLQHGPDLRRLPRNVRYGQEAYLIPGRRDPVSRRRVDPIHQRHAAVFGPLDRIARGVV